MARPEVALILTDDERVQLDSLAHRSRTAPHLARRARIILACAGGDDNKAVAKRLHFTPTYGSWLNLVERWFAALTNKQLRRGVHRSVAQLETAICEFIAAHHARPKPFIWTKSA